MKRLILLFLHFSAIVSGQVSFDFESGSLETWTKSRDSAWIVTEKGVLSGRLSLRHNLDDSLSGEDRISFAYDSLVVGDSKITWQFRLRHSYLPSSSNKWAVFLLSDHDQEQMRPGGKDDAIILGVNFKGSDDILRLWRMRDAGSEVLCETNLNWQQEIGTGSAYLQVERNPDGVWSIFVWNNSWKLTGLCRDTLPIPADHFGIYYRFSSKQDRKLWIDDILVQGSYVRDNIPPEIFKLKVLDEKTMRIIFTEDLSPESAVDKENYKISGTQEQPEAVEMFSGNTVDLMFRKAFPSGKKDTLEVLGIADRRGNISGLMEKEFTWYRASRGDIVFTEIMYDPSPVIGLPENEFLEIYNRSGFSIDIGGWTVRSGNRSMVLPSYSHKPGEYLLLCYKESADKYPGSEAVLEALTSRTVLSNGGGFIFLLDRDSVLIDWMEYSPALHENEYYASGGWSLEKIDHSRLCHGNDNWSSSKNRDGGSPGKENSVNRPNPDLEAPKILSLHLPDHSSLVIRFNESMNIRSLPMEKPELADSAGSPSFPWNEDSGMEAWRIDPGPGSPDSIIVNDPFNTEARLVYKKGFEKGKDYYLEPGQGIRDCSGNAMAPRTSYRFAIPAQPGRSSILLSEILFNPIPFCPDFVEIYNPGPETYDLADLLLANRDSKTNELSSFARLTVGHRLIFPEEYLAFTEDVKALGMCCRVIDPDFIIEVRDLPAMGDDRGSVILLDKYLEVIDEFGYDSHMHHPGLPSGEGVSLERISFSSPSANRSNWHSASSNEGYGTPGRQNSQQEEINISEEGFELVPKIFTPDMDGIDDLLFIKYHFSSPGLTARILVFDPRGRLVRDIAGIQLLGTEGFFTWDGTNQDGKTAKAGLYLVFAEVYDAVYGRHQFKETCILSKGR